MSLWNDFKKLNSNKFVDQTITLGNLMSEYENKNENISFGDALNSLIDGTATSIRVSYWTEDKKIILCDTKLNFVSKYVNVSWRPNQFEMISNEWRRV